MPQLSSPRLSGVACKTSKKNISHGLEDKGAGVVIKFRVRIPQNSLVVLGSVSNLKMLLCYIRKPCSVASIVGEPSVTLKGKQPENKAEVKSVIVSFLISKTKKFLLVFLDSSGHFQRVNICTRMNPS